MKAVSLLLDRLLANPSIEQVRGKLTLVTDDRSKIILELKTKQIKTVFGPFGEMDLKALVKKEVIVFVRPGEESWVFDVKVLPREKNAAPRASSGSTRTSSSREPKADLTKKGPLVKWKKFAEARMIGEPVKLTSMVKGFDIELPFLEAMLKHIEVVSGQNTKVISYLDFRKVFLFMCSPQYRVFESEYDNGKHRLGV
jgi:hypothetical protein